MTTDKIKAIRVMRDAGKAFCDEAIRKWIGDYYGDIGEDLRKSMIKEWQTTKDEIDDIYFEMIRSDNV